MQCYSEADRIFHVDKVGDSMTRRGRYPISAVTVRRCEAAGCRTPCVDVKVRTLPSRLPHDVRDQDPDNEIYNMTVEQWWESVPSDLIERVLAPAFPDCELTAHADGNSGGWLCVSGTELPEEWSDEQFGAWGVFEQRVHQSIVDFVQVYIDNLRLNLPAARRASTPHGRCAQAGYCVEHRLNKRVPACDRAVRR